MSGAPPFHEWFPDAALDGRYGYTLETLRTSAPPFFRIPVRVEAALRDQAVPPPGQFAVAKAVPAAPV